MEPSSKRSPPEDVLATYDRLLMALDRVLELAERVGDDDLLEWSGLAALDAADVGEQLGMLFDTEAEERRTAIRAVIEHLDERPVRRDNDQTARGGT
jgi:hypothetical protein